jgi:neopullulanase
MTSTTRPAWVSDAVFYQIFPDRFAPSERVAKPSNLEPWDSPPTPHGYKGGDLLGVVEHLDWLSDLGINAIYFNPVFQSASNHRYHTHDYFKVDPMLGGDAAFTEMLAACQERGIRVVLDGVFNHASRGFYRFNDVLENGASSAWVDWFTINGYPLNAYDDTKPLNYAAWWNLPALPKLNTETPAVREYLMGVAEHWVRKGIDGWRLDVPGEITTEGFWEEMRARVRAINPEAYIVGEVWDDASEWINDESRFDGVMNYPMTAANLRFAAAGGIDQIVAEPVPLDLSEPLDAAGYDAAVTEHLHAYADSAHRANLNLLGSHDTPRVLSMVSEDSATVRLATALMLTFPGAPSIYYGDEIGMKGHHDPGCRGGFPWKNEASWNQDLLATHRELIALRHSESSLRHGDYTTLSAAGDLYVFSRRLGGDGTVVAVNAGVEPAAASVAGVTEHLWGSGTASDGRVEMPGRSAGVWRLR